MVIGLDSDVGVDVTTRMPPPPLLWAAARAVGSVSVCWCCTADWGGGVGKCITGKACKRPVQSRQGAHSVAQQRGV